MISHWLKGEETIPTLDEASLSLARRRVREVGAQQGMQEPQVEAMATVVTELGQNQLRHARAGEVLVRPIQRGGVPGLEVVAADAGLGIADPTRALLGSHSTLGSLGIGLSGALRLSDEADVDVRQGEGTCVWTRKFARAVPRHREVAILGAPFPGEPVSGDHAAFRRRDGELLLVVADGLGHGQPAQEAARRAVEAVLAAPGRPAPGALVEVAHDSLLQQRHSRGAVMGVALWQEPEAPGEVLFAGAGDTAGCVCEGMRQQHLLGAARVLGLGPARAAPHAPQRLVTGAGSVLVLCTDGLHSLHRALTLPLRREHPMLLAHHLFQQLAKRHDDALVLVAR